MSVQQEIIVLDLLTVKRATLPATPESFRGPPALLGERWYPAGFGAAAMAGTAIAIDTIRALPFWSARGGSVNALLFNVTVVGGAGSVARVGVYEADQDRLFPTNLLVDSGTIATDVGVEGKITPVDLTLDPATLYFFAYRCGVSAPTISTLSASHPMFGYNSVANQQFGYIVTGQPFGAFPAVFPTGAGFGYMTNTPPFIAVRFS